MNISQLISIYQIACDCKKSEKSHLEKMRIDEIEQLKLKVEILVYNKVIKDLKNLRGNK